MTKTEAVSPPGAPRGGPPDTDALPAGVHPLLNAGRFVLLDLLSTLVFVGLYAATHNVYLATFLGIAGGVAEIGYEKYHGAPIATMQWLSLVLVIGFGTATLMTHNPVFIMLKPTLVYCIVGAVMLKPGWINRYLPPVAQRLAGDVTFVFGYVWAGLMFVTAGANFGFALFARPALYGWFLSVFPIASKIVLILMQYGVTRFFVRQRRRLRGDALAA